MAVVVAVAVVVVVGVLLAGCSRGAGGSPGTNDGAVTTAGAAESAPGSAPGSAQGGCAGPWDCAQQERFAATAALLARVDGHVGIVVRDRVTGAVWQDGEATYRIWAGSTPKLAFAVALWEQARAGQITLDATAQRQVAAMLSVSDNAAADALWNRYAQARAADVMRRWRTAYGMTDATYVDGFPSRWGFVKTTAHDLANLMSYILDTMDPADRVLIVDAMRSVGQVQRWGVWGAGAALRPGVKAGWSVESDDGHDHWITATVGFAGPAERYVVAAMYHQPPGGDTIDRGVHVLTDLVATVFGAPVPAPAVVPPPD